MEQERHRVAAVRPAHGLAQSSVPRESAELREVVPPVPQLSLTPPSDPLATALGTQHAALGLALLCCRVPMSCAFT